MTDKTRILVATLVLVCVVTGHAAKTEDFAPDKTVVYKKVGDLQLKLDIFYPPGRRAADKRPCIVFFHGGAWNGGAPSQFYPHCDYLASRGMVAMSAEYRIKSRHGTSPRECVQDGKSAIRWIRQHAGELGIDRNMLAAGGGSAGGHIAAATGTVEGFCEEGEDQSISFRPDALVLFNPVFDNGPNGWGHSRVKEYWRDISPMHKIDKKTPPTVVFLGTKDSLVPTTTAEEYKKRMERKGIRCDLHLYKDQKHAFFNFKNKKYFTLTVIEADRFLASLGYLEGKPTLQNKPDAGDDK